MPGHHIAILLKTLNEQRLLPDQLNQSLEMQRAVRAALPSSIAPQVSVSHVSAGTLTIHANNGACATKVKHFAPQFIRLLQALGYQVNGIRVRVQALDFANTLSKKENLMTLAGQQSISRLVERLNESPLKSALMRLGNRSPHDN
jgi:hypothetical protein